MLQNMETDTLSMARTGSWLMPLPLVPVLGETPTLTTMSCGPWEKGKVRE